MSVATAQAAAVGAIKPVRTVMESVVPSWAPDSGTNSGCVG
jgi:hypothetical protein